MTDNDRKTLGELLADLMWQDIESRYPYTHRSSIQAARDNWLLILGETINLDQVARKFLEAAEIEGGKDED